MRRLAALLTSLVVLGLGIVGSAAGAGPAAAAGTARPGATEATAAGAVTITVGEVTPDVVHPDSTLTVRATVTNTSTTDTLEAKAGLSIERVLMLTRSSVAAWADSDLAAPVGYLLDSEPVVLAPGASTEVSLTSSAAALGLLATAAGTGPRGIAVTVDGTLGPETGRLAAYRTYVLWQPIDADSITPVSVSVLAPVSGLPQDVDALTAQAGRLERVLSATADVRGVTWAVDPAIVVAARDGAASVVPDDLLETLRTGASTGGEPATGTPEDGTPEDGTPGDGTTAPGTSDDTDGAASTPTTAGDGAGSASAASADGGTTVTAASAWADRLLAAAPRHEVWALPLLDTSTAVTASVPRAVTAAESLVTAASAVAGSWRTGLTVPDVDAPGVSILTSAVASGAPTVVARKGYAPKTELTYTPTARTTVTTSAGDATVLVADQTLGSLLVDPSDTSPATARQRVLAELAVISNERPGEPRTVLVSLPRDWSPNPTVAREQLGVLASSPWSRAVPLSTLRQTPDPDLPRTVPSERSVTRQLARAGLAPLTSSSWSRLVTQQRSLATFAAITEDPSVLRDPVSTATVMLASVWLEGDHQQRLRREQALDATVDAVLASQSVIIGSDVNLISAQGALPVTLRNDLDQDVTVAVRLAPDDKRLRAEPLDDTVVPADSEVQVEIPVRAVGSGDVTVAVQLLGPDGRVVSSPATFQVRVRADWENVGTAVVAAILALTLVVGVWRTIRRGRRRTRTTEGPGDTTPDEPADDLPQDDGGTARASADDDTTSETAGTP